MTYRIDVVSLPVADQEAAKRFYTEKLGFSVLRDEQMGPEHRWLQLAPPEGETSITLVNWFETLRPGGQQGLVLSCADIEAARDRLLGEDIVVSEVGEQHWGRWATFSDPDGNGWVLTQVSKDH